MDMATGRSGDPGAVRAEDGANALQLRPGLRRVAQHRADELAGDGGIRLHRPHAWPPRTGVVSLLARTGSEPGVVERPGHLGGIGSVELDLDAEGLVGIPYHV